METEWTVIGSLSLASNGDTRSPCSSFYQTLSAAQGGPAAASTAARALRAPTFPRGSTTHRRAVPPAIAASGAALRVVGRPPIDGHRAMPPARDSAVSSGNVSNGKHGTGLEQPRQMDERHGDARARRSRAKG
ncbi:hypothetical protein [Cupriavidus sp. UGS-1]|uniref:hypothetical protein n=1 Tax=Cupriavidus sp. UGS-1 TaxID=2899826 RepID=UPI001E6344DA|nr:hypothetical protein [Cupriavidus sp. UGS-1]MCD9121478.1 hypothetical protein [Cupriavidus sp. UGS-1]